MEQARRSALAHHVHRTAPMGPRVLINGIWYKSNDVEIEFHAIDSPKNSEVLLYLYRPLARAKPSFGMAGSRANQKQAGGQNERFRKYRISHFRLQARRERNCRRGFLGTFRAA